MKLLSLLVLSGFGSSKVVTLNKGGIYFMLLVSTFYYCFLVSHGVSGLAYVHLD